MQNTFLQFDANFVAIGETDWNDLVRAGTNIAFDGIVAAIRQVIGQGGHFMILNDDDSVQRRIDRMSELEELIAHANELRRHADSQPKE